MLFSSLARTGHDHLAPECRAQVGSRPRHATPSPIKSALSRYLTWRWVLFLGLCATWAVLVIAVVILTVMPARP